MMELQGVSKSFGPLRLLEDFSFTARGGEVACLLGPSGCGKTTILNLLAGILKPDSGEVLLPGRISFVFQESRLLPWSSLAENAGYAMDPALPRDEKEGRLHEMLDLMELGDAAEKKPSEVSGGMARRCALARALLAPYAGLLLDEPLSSLDPEMRQRILDRLPGLIEGRPAILVTHDHGVASVLSDRIYKLTEPPVKISEVKKGNLENIIMEIEKAPTATQGGF